MNTASLAGTWRSTYTYGEGATSQHVVVLEQVQGGLAGHSLPQVDGSVLALDLRYDAEEYALSGFWREQTAPDGLYGGKAFHGVLQLLVRAEGTEAHGAWAGFNSGHSTVHTGAWTLHKQ